MAIDKIPLNDAKVNWCMSDGSSTESSTGGLQVANDLKLKGCVMTLYTQIQFTLDKWGSSILSWSTTEVLDGFRLQAIDDNSGKVLRFELETDWDDPRNEDRPLRLGVPASMIGEAGCRHVIVRFTGPKLELFVDGVLVDEEWPVGALKSATSKLLLVSGNVKQVAVWNRVLSDDEIVILSGGKEMVTHRNLEILGTERTTLNYWKPRGHNTSAGDCMPSFHNGRFHLFYLFDRRHHGSKWHLGAHQWAHASSTDLKTWEHHPFAVPISRQWEGSICTGSTFFHRGTYYAFYAARMHDGRPGQLTVATSADGIHFTKGDPLFTLAPPYEPVNARDPNVFRDPETGLFHMLVTTQVLDPPIPGQAACLAHLVSCDLLTWEQQEPVWVPGECPDCFEWNGWHYLLTGHEGVTRYRISRSWFGPWKRPRVDLLDGPQSYVMKTAKFGENRRIGVAWVGEHGWGGHTVFREVVQHEDGTLGSAWVPEMIPHTDDPVSLSLDILAGEMSTGVKRLTMSAPCELGITAARGVPRNFHFCSRVVPRAGSAAFGLAVRGEGSYEKGHELRVEPFRRKIGWRPCQSNTVEERERFALYDVEGLDQPFTLNVLVLDDLLDICVDNRRTLIVRMEECLEGDTLFFFAYCGQVVFEDIEIRPLKPLVSESS